MIKNRKLVIKNADLAKYFNIEAIETAIAEVPDEAWFNDADSETEIDQLFNWWMVSTGHEVWLAVDRAFTIEPLTPEATRASLTATIKTAKATIAEAEKRLAELGE